MAAYRESQAPSPRNLANAYDSPFPGNPGWDLRACRPMPGLQVCYFADGAERWFAVPVQFQLRYRERVYLLPLVRIDVWVIRLVAAVDGRGNSGNSYDHLQPRVGDRHWAGDCNLHSLDSRSEDWWTVHAGNDSRLCREPSRSRVSVVRSLSAFASHGNSFGPENEPCRILSRRHPCGVLCTRKVLARDERDSNAANRLLSHASTAYRESPLSGDLARCDWELPGRLGRLREKLRRCQGLPGYRVVGRCRLFSGDELRPGAMVDRRRQLSAVVRADRSLGCDAARQP